MIAAIWNLPGWILVPLILLGMGALLLILKWSRGVMRRARALLFTSESLFLALLYVSMALGIQYATTILQVSYLDRDVVIAGK